MKTLFAVHHVFDCLDYNEHFYFTSFAEAFDRLTEIKKSIQEHMFIEEVYTDRQDDFYVHIDDGLQRVYIEEINL
jgi:hypothetical protein